MKLETDGIYMKDMESLLMMYFILDQCYWKDQEDMMGAFLGEISPDLLTDGGPADEAVLGDWKKSIPIPIKDLTNENILQYIRSFLEDYQKEFGSGRPFEKTLKRLQEVSEEDIREAAIKTKTAYNKYHYDD